VKRVLIVDDDASIRALLRMTLPSDVYEVIEAADGSEVMELLEQGAPDLIVLDWKMPGRHGAFVLDDLKARHPQLPVIVLTAEARDTQRVLAEALRADAFLTKPFSPLQLLETIERLLGPTPTTG